MRSVLIIGFLLIHMILQSQNTMILEGNAYVNSDISWNGVYIPNNVPARFNFRNNSIKSKNLGGYMLNCGTDGPTIYDNNLDNSIIYGNKLIWDGIEGEEITHGVILGYNINYQVRFNYFSNISYTLVVEGTDSMEYSCGGIHYNIFKKGRLTCIAMAGQSNVSIYNNTFYSNKPNYSFIKVTYETGQITDNAKIKNNIFYAVNDHGYIAVDSNAMKTLECDYNIYWNESSENNEPYFTNISTYEKYTWDDWRALGFDQHSVIINPRFIDTLGFLPSIRLDNGINLGVELEYGLSNTNVWVVGEFPDTIQQNGIWQVGARLYDQSFLNPQYISSYVMNSSPSRIYVVFSKELSNILPDVSAFSVFVNNVKRLISAVSIDKEFLIVSLAEPIIYGDNITITYNKPYINPLTGYVGGQVESFIPVSVINEVQNVNGIHLISDDTNFVNVYPVPSSGSLNVVFSNPISEYNFIKLVNLKGQVLYTDVIESGTQRLQLYLNTNEKIYILHLGYGNRVLFSKVIVAL